MLSRGLEWFCSRFGVAKPKTSVQELLQDEAQRVEALLVRRSALITRQAELEKKIRDLGSLPADAFDKQRGRPLPELHKALHRAQAQLKKFGCARHLETLLFDSQCQYPH